MIETKPPARFPVKPEYGFKGGSILWDDADTLMRVWQSRYGRNSTDHTNSMIRIACAGGLPASELDSLNRKLKQDTWFMNGKSTSVEWRNQFIAGDSAHWTEQAIAIFGKLPDES